MTARERITALLEQKSVRHVRTPAGVRHYGQPIGSVIVADTGNNPLPNITVVPSEHAGWEKYKGADGKHYYVGKAEGFSGVSVTDDNDDEIHYEEGGNAEVRALTWLSDRAVNAPKISTRQRAASIAGQPLLKPGMHHATDEERKRLRIPPAWTSVQIADDPNSALVATGRDVKGRPQSIYSAEHTSGQAEKKFARIKVLAKHMDELDARLDKDAMEDDSAAAMLLIRRLGMRPGSNKDTGGEVQAFGATNLQARHVYVTPGGKTVFDFTGKKGVGIKISTQDPLVADVIRERLKTRSRYQPLFDTNEVKTREYFRSVVPGNFYLKDMRTLHANVIAFEEVKKVRKKPKTKTEFRAKRKEVAVKVSDALGNTPTIALASYINPAVFSPWVQEEGWE